MHTPKPVSNFFVSESYIGVLQVDQHVPAETSSCICGLSQEGMQINVKAA